MGLPTILKELEKKSEKDIAKQIQYILQQLDKPDSEQDEEAPTDDEEPAGTDDGIEEEYSDVDEQEIDKDIVSRGIPTGETLLISEFGMPTGSTPHDVSPRDSSLNQPIAETEKESDKDESSDRKIAQILEFPLIEEVKNASVKDEQKPQKKGLQEIVYYPSIPDNAHRVPTPIVAKTDVTPKEQKSEESNERVPTAMQSRPKIPRTPIPEEKLEQAKKENELFRKQALHIYVNEGANLKKRKMMEHITSGDDYSKYIESSREDEQAKNKYKSSRGNKSEEQKFQSEAKRKYQDTPQPHSKRIYSQPLSVSSSVSKLYGVEYAKQRDFHSKRAQGYNP